MNRFPQKHPASCIAIQTDRTVLAQRVPWKPVPFGMDRSLEEQHEMEAQHDKEKARMNRDLGLAETADSEGASSNRESPVPSPHHHVERYLAAPISEKLRQRFEDYLDAHPEFSEEEAVVTLLGRALDSEDFQGNVQSPQEKKAVKMVCLAEMLLERARKRCAF